MPYAVLPGVRLWYADEGSGPVLLLVHGIGTTHEDWEFQIPRFARHYRVIAPDLRGFGRSEAASGFTVAQFAADLWALLDGLGIGGILLAGHSMGGAVALQMAVERPQRVTKLVAADTLPSFETNSFGRRLMFAYRYLMVSALGPRRLAGAVARRLLPGPQLTEVRERFHRRSAAGSGVVYLQTLQALVDWTVERELGRLAMPVLVIAAGHDYFPLEEARRFAAALPDARLVVFAGGHHALPLEMPERFGEELESFFA